MKYAVLISLLTLAACSAPCEPVPPGALGELTQWEQTFLRERRLPPVASRAAVLAEDGLALSFTDWRATTPAGPVVLLVHGSSAHGALYATLGKGLAEAGVHARLVDLRGHGHSRCVRADDCAPQAVTAYIDDGATWPGRPGDSADAHQLTRDVQAHLQALRADFPDAPLFLVGHSSGAGLVTRYVEMNGMSQLGGVALLAPFLHADQPQNTLQTWECGRVVGSSYARVNLGALGDARRGNPHRYVLSLDKPASLVDALDTLQYTYTTMNGMHVADLDTAMNALTGPTLWVSADKDALLDLTVSRSVAERAPGLTAFVTALDTSHVGIIWSMNVANLLAEFAKNPGLRPAQTLAPGP